MCQLLFLALFLITILPAILSSKKTVDVGQLIQKQPYKTYKSYQLPLSEHRLPQINHLNPPESTSYGIREDIIDESLLKNNQNNEENSLKVPDSIFNADIIMGRALPNAGGIYQSQNSFNLYNHLSSNLVRAEIPRRNPPVIGTIGSGSLGYTALGNGLFAVGSGSLGFAAYVPSQMGKGSITFGASRTQNPNKLAANYLLNNFNPAAPHAYPKPMDLKRELSQQTGL